MAAFMLSRMSATKANQVLYIMPAIDQPETASSVDKQLLLKLLQVPSMSRTKGLPGLCCFHMQQKVRFTANMAPPFVTQNTEGTIVGFDPDHRDTTALLSLRHNCTGEVQLRYMPKAVYVKIDDCTDKFLPPCACAEHVDYVCGYHPECPDCSANAEQPGQSTQRHRVTDCHASAALAAARRN